MSYKISPQNEAGLRAFKDAIRGILCRAALCPDTPFRVEYSFYVEDGADILWESQAAAYIVGDPDKPQTDLPQAVPGPPYTYLEISVPEMLRYVAVMNSVLKGAQSVAEEL